MTEKLKSRKGIGGWRGHKEGCPCRPCTANRRKAEAIEKPPVKALIDMNDPDLVAQIAVTGFPENDWRRHVAGWAQLIIKEPGITNAECAARLGITEGTLRVYKWRARKEGFLQIADPIDRLMTEGIPQAVDTIIDAAGDGKDTKAAIELLKGLGVFKSHAQVKQEGPKQQNIAHFEINIPAGAIIGPSENVRSSPNVIDVVAEQVSEGENDASRAG